MPHDCPITVAHGDGIGPEIMEATLRILKEAGARLAIEKIEIGESVYLRGEPTGIEGKSWDSLRRTKVFLKAPITTPQGGGFKSLNVTVRNTLGLYANVRPCVAYHPFIETKHPGMDVVIVRENEEDLYVGIEHRQTDEVVQALKLISRPGSERIVRYAFEYARANGRRRVSCFVKDNILKHTDGLFRSVFDEIAAEYPDLVDEKNKNWIVDIGAAKLADAPESFDVVVMPNLYGDILSDVAAQIAGSVGLAVSANIGEQCAMFEAIHGSAPRRAGQNVANPSGLLHGAILMLIHIGQPEIAERVHNAWLATIEEGFHTYDVFAEGRSREKVGTREFASAVIERLGRAPSRLKAVSYAKAATKPAAAVASAPRSSRPRAKKALVGVDVFLEWHEGRADRLAGLLKEMNGGGLELSMITNRGVRVWPGGFPDTICVDHWRCRFAGKTPTGVIEHRAIADLLARLAKAGFDFVQTESLQTFDGVAAFTQALG